MPCILVIDVLHHAFVLMHYTCVMPRARKVSQDECCRRNMALFELHTQRLAPCVHARMCTCAGHFLLRAGATPEMDHEHACGAIAMAAGEREESFTGALRVAGAYACFWKTHFFIALFIQQ
jgi:hypothetical protein